MPALIAWANAPYDLEADGLRASLLDLRDSGESLLVVAPMTAGLRPPFVMCASAAEVESAWEEELIPAVALTAAIKIPAWIDGAEYGRALLFVSDLMEEGTVARREWSAGERLTGAEMALLDALLDAECDTVDLAPPAAAEKLSQSWASGRRVGLRVRR